MALVNLIFRQVLTPFRQETEEAFVSILIPVRNEEENITTLLDDILQLNYANMEIIVFNDQSDDSTEEIIKSYVAKEHRIRLINSPGLPEGWMGKNFACHSLAEEAKGEYFLFLDADVRIKNNAIDNTIGYMRRFKLGFLSIFPAQIMKSFGERISVPVMHYILLSLLPLILVRKVKQAALAAANGQFMLFSSSVYKEYLPHLQMKKCRVEDIEIARYLKREQVKIACITGNTDIECRMYQNLNEAINGFSKNVTTFFGNSFVLAILFWLITSFGFIPVILSLSNPELITYLSVIVLTRFFVSIASRQNFISNILLFPLQQIAFGLFIYKAFINTIRKQYRWKDRNISY